jgi:alpha-galactosidase
MTFSNPPVALHSLRWMAAVSILMMGLTCTSLHAADKTTSSDEFLKWAPTPPMGWNSWDCFGAAVNEEQTRGNADYMAEHLKQHGWEYIVVDIQWYEPMAKGWDYRKNAKLTMDANGRLLPAPNRFPSAADGKGFKALADYIHSKGLKFGLHMMRGIPRQAVRENTPVLGTSFHAADIADKSSTCPWNGDMFGVDLSKPGAQEYYDSIFAQYASWDLDFIKVDDLSRPYHQPEIEAIRKAIDHCGRPIVFSTSPGATPLTQGDHIGANANMWRISDDFWDRWKPLKEQFDRCDKWTRYSGPGHYPDADMLPLGAIRAAEHGHTGFTRDEQYTLMTLWSICRSPLMFGGHLPDTDEFTLTLITNDEVLAVDQKSTEGRQLFRHDDLIAWTANVPNSSDKYVALFNAQDALANGGAGVAVPVNLTDLGFSDSCRVRDLWKHTDLGTFNNQLAQMIPFHGAGLYRVGSP